MGQTLSLFYQLKVKYIVRTSEAFSTIAYTMYVLEQLSLLYEAEVFMLYRSQSSSYLQVDPVTAEVNYQGTDLEWAE